MKELCDALCKQKWKQNISSFGKFASCVINVNETNDHKIAMEVNLYVYNAWFAKNEFSFVDWW